MENTTKKNPYSQIEEDILKFWDSNEIFKKSVEARSSENRYVFYDGPPFATGLPHYGHILSSVIKDLVPRYFTMKGFRVERRWGWDCHGLPIETLVEKKLSISGKKQIEEQGIDKFNREARGMVLDYASQWKDMVGRIGRWVDFDHSYKTMDTDYMESVWWALKALDDKKLIYEGNKVLMYCTRCETPVSNAEISMDNSYKEISEEAVTVKFPVIEPEKHALPPKTFFLAWTTTPWTLPGNVALAVGKDIEYSLIKCESDHLIVATERVEEVLKNKKYERISTLAGKDLLGISYQPLFEIESVKDSGKKVWYVTDANFVTVEDGTGMVHIAVMYGENDHELGLKKDLPGVQLLDPAGKFNDLAPSSLAGINFKDSEEKIKTLLENENLLFFREQYTHSYPFCWRCETPLIYNAISAWFINIQKNKAKIIELNKKINWFPKNLKYGRFLNILETAPDWNISRNRYWATPLPFWKCQKCGSYKCIGSIKELKEKSDNFGKVYPDPGTIDLHRPYVDEVKIKCDCGAEMVRVKEVIDCWVESAAMPFAQWHYPFENKEAFTGGFPGQFIAEYIAQTRAWFYYMHALSVLLFDDISFENVVATGTILNEKGEKLSKSKNNYPDPWGVIDKYGADALRFYQMTSVVMQADNLFFSETDLKDIYNKIINTAYNIVKFYEIYSHQLKSKEIEFGKLNLLDRWILSKLERTIKTVDDSLSRYNTVKGGKAIRALIGDLSTWWLRRSRERFRNVESFDAQNALNVLYYCLKNLAKIMAPYTPFLSESIWQKLKNEQEQSSVHLEDWPTAKDEYIDTQIEHDMEIVRKIVEKGHFLRSKCSLKVRQPLGKLYYKANLSGHHEELESLVLNELNVQKIVAKNEIKHPEGTTFEGIEVAIETEISPELQKLGDVREVTRAIQHLRKKMGYEQGESLTACYNTEDRHVEDFISDNVHTVKEKTVLKDFKTGKISGGEGVDVVLSCGKVVIWICENQKN